MSDRLDVSATLHPNGKCVDACFMRRRNNTSSIRMHVKRTHARATVVAPGCADIQCRELWIALEEHNQELASIRAREEICEMATILRPKPTVNAEYRHPRRKRQVRSAAHTGIANPKDDRPPIGTRRYGGTCVEKWFCCVRPRR